MKNRNITDLMRFQYRELFGLASNTGAIADNQTIKSAIASATVNEVKDCHGKHYAVGSNGYNSVKNTLIALESPPQKKVKEQPKRMNQALTKVLKEQLERLDYELWLMKLEEE